MGWLNPGPRTQITTYSGLQVQSTSAAQAIPILYGANVISPNVIWYNEFRQRYSGGGGKGAKSGASSYYTCALMMMLCEGPIQAVGSVWCTSPTAQTLADFNLNLIAGAVPQTTWSYIAANHPSEALSYPGVAMVVSSYYNLGQSATVGSYNIEVHGPLYGTGFNSIDADPALIINDFLTNSQWGVGFPGSAIDATTLLGGSGSSSLQCYAWASGIAFSPALASPEKGGSIIDRWCQLVNCEAVWAGGRLKFIPYGDATFTGNGQTFAPNISPLYDLSDDDFLYSSGEDPVRVIRSDPFAISNRISVECTNRSFSYNTGPITVFDQAMINRFGLKVGTTVSAHEICDINIAQIVAQLILQRHIYVRNTYSFKLGPEWARLDPMDLITLTDAALGLNKTVVRVIDQEEDDAGVITFTCEEFPQGVATATLYANQTRSSGFPNPQVTPASVNTPLLVEPPPDLTGGTYQLWVGASPVGGDPNWGGCQVWISIDNVTYQQVGTITTAAMQGVLTANLPAYSSANPDNTNTLAVDLSQSLGTLTNSTATNAAFGVPLCIVDGEFLSYTTATLTSTSHYNLTGLYRGLDSSAAAAHSTSAPFCLLDNSIFRYAVPQIQVGMSLWVKLPSFNIFGQQTQDISACTAYHYTVQGRGSIGPVGAALALGTNMDYGRVSEAVTESDDFGNVIGDPSLAVDLGGVT